mmetsp:Transcript_13968/g.36079  ORF Transcript_13968/g.36079 Transcript_13968/m.36079 type:complete len:91 (-) Transcript_13968:731-1003(-)
MKFGKLMAYHLANDDVLDWPCIQYKQLKKSIERRLLKGARASLFETGGFKKSLRLDILAINTFWLEKEMALTSESSSIIEVRAQAAAAAT